MNRIYPHRRNDLKRKWIVDSGIGTRKRYFTSLRIRGVWYTEIDYEAPKGEPWAWLFADKVTMLDKNTIFGEI